MRLLTGIVYIVYFRFVSFRCTTGVRLLEFERVKGGSYMLTPHGCKCLSGEVPGSSIPYESIRVDADVEVVAHSRVWLLRHTVFPAVAAVACFSFVAGGRVANSAEKWTYMVYFL